MSNGGSGSGSRVSIPTNVRSTIHDIREITGKQHTDEDIYTVLKDCSMDPNETIQKLIFLDTFHVVKRKPRRKEVLNNMAPEDYRSSSHTLGRWTRGVRGNYNSQHVSSGTLPNAGGGRNTAVRRENGVGQRNASGSTFSSSQVVQITKNDITPHVTKVSSAIPNDPKKLSNGSSSLAHAPPSVSFVIDSLQDCPTKMNNDTAPPLSSVADEHLSKNVPTFGSVIGDAQTKSSTNSDQSLSSGVPSSASSLYSSASDPVLVPTIISRHQSAVGSQRVVTEPNHNQIDKHISPSAGDSELSKDRNVANIIVSSKLKAAEKAQVTDPPQSSSLGIHDDSAIRFSSIHDHSPQAPVTPSTVAESEVVAVCAKSNSQPVPDSNVCARQHVTFPDHFQVPEALKNGLTFGSFDTHIGLSIKSNIPPSENYSPPAVEASQDSDDSAMEHPSQNIASIAHEGDGLHDVKTSVVERGPSEGNVESGLLLQYDQVRQAVLLHPEVTQNPSIQNATNYSSGLVPSMQGSHFVQFEAPVPQVVSSLPNFGDGNSSVVSTPTPTPSPPIIQPTGITPNSMLFPYYRHPYPPNFFPYGPYFSPFLMPPMHQFLGPNGLPQQPYLSSAAAAGVKYSVPQFKAGPNLGNATHIGLPSGYGSYNASHVGFGPAAAVSSGSSVGGEDHGASQLKENHNYTTGQMSEGSAVWFSAPGQDMSGLPLSSVYNLPPQGQHVSYPPMQANHGAYPGIYPPSQTLAAPSTVLPLTQSSQAVAGGAETVGPQSGVYQQSQQAQMNWNANF